MPVDTVVTGVDLPSDEPLPEGWFACVERGRPSLVPVQHGGVLLEVPREVIEAKPVVDALVSHVSLSNERGGGLVGFLLLPMHRYLFFRYLLLRHDSFPIRYRTFNILG